MELIAFDTADAATVAGWPASPDEAVHWCGQLEVTPTIVAGWDDGQAFGLVDDGVLVGYGELWVDEEEDEVELARLIVDPARRRQGVGRQLVSRLAERARSYDTGTVFLRVHPNNASATRVYLAAGFHFVDDATAVEWNEGQPVTYRWLVG